MITGYEREFYADVKAIRKALERIAIAMEDKK